MRVFIAIDIKDESIRNNIIGYQKMILNEIKDAKPTRQDQLHFTLMFLGEINNIMLQSIKERLLDMSFKPLNVTYKGIGAFPDLRNARIVWVGVDEDSSKKLSNIAKMVEERLSPLGFKSERFHAHVTILRVKNRINLKMISNDVFGTELVDEIKVKESQLTPSGPIYSDLFTIHAS